MLFAVLVVISTIIFCYYFHSKMFWCSSWFYSRCISVYCTVIRRIFRYNSWFFSYLLKSVNRTNDAYTVGKKKTTESFKKIYQQNSIQWDSVYSEILHKKIPAKEFLCFLCQQYPFMKIISTDDYFHNFILQLSNHNIMKPEVSEFFFFLVIFF